MSRATAERPAARRKASRPAPLPEVKLTAPEPARRVCASCAAYGYFHAVRADGLHRR